MRTRLRMTLVIAGTLGLVGPAVRAAADAPTTAPPASAVARLDPGVIRQAAGADVTSTPDGVVRLSWPREDTAVVVDGVALRPAAGLTSWAAFAPTASGALLMGDTVVFEDEVDAAIDAAFAHGLEVTGLHNHFFFDQPKVYFMHVGGAGAPAQLARGVKAVWDAIRIVRRGAPAPAASYGGAAPASGSLDRPSLERLLGHPATVQDGVFKVTIGREAEMHGVRVGGAMGLTTWIAFSGSDRLAAAAGDVILAAGEVQSVLRALRRAGFHVVALHNHMIGEVPAYYFVHFWSKGPAGDLARGFRVVLDAQATAAQRESH